MRFSLFFFLALSSTAQFKRPAEALELGIPPAEIIPYAAEDPKLQFGELRVPLGNGPHPVVILVHGGCWSSQLGTSDPRIVSFELLRPLAKALHDAGVASWNIEYRRAGDKGGGWPGTFQDVSLAVDHLRTLARSKKLNLDKVVVAGHSSGGHLAFWLAARHKLPAGSPLYTKTPLRLKATVNLDGPPDVEKAQPLEQKFCPPPDAITRFMGGTPAQYAERYRAASLTAYLPIGVKQVLLMAGLLNRSPELAKDHEATARAKGDDVTVEVLEKTGHFDLLFPALPEGRRTIEVLLRLLK